MPRLRFEGETQINSNLTGYGQWEYNLRVTTLKGADAQTGNKTRLALAGIKYANMSYINLAVTRCGL
ncbi:porin [Shigella flexneri]